MIDLAWFYLILSYLAVATLLGLGVAGQRDKAQREARRWKLTAQLYAAYINRWLEVENDQSKQAIRDDVRDADHPAV